MQLNSRYTQDRRHTSRIPAMLKCEFNFDQTTHQAVMLNVSLTGAFLSSKCLPPDKSAISIFINSKHLQKTLTINGVVVRGNWVMSGDRKLGRFGVRFQDIPLGLISLLKGLQVGMD